MANLLLAHRCHVTIPRIGVEEDLQLPAGPCGLLLASWCSRALL